MCYQKCRYEDHDGECGLKDGTKPPIDAMCGINDLGAENAMLRELVRDLWLGLSCPTEPMDGCFQCPYDRDGGCSFEQRTAELGINVYE